MDMGGIDVYFIHMVLFYGYKVLKMCMQRKCVSFYSYGSFSWL